MKKIEEFIPFSLGELITEELIPFRMGELIEEFIPCSLGELASAHEASYAGVWNNFWGIQSMRTFFFLQILACLL